MPTVSAITHADLAPKDSALDLGSKSGVLLNILCILSGLLCFILCLTAEASRSQVTWVEAKGDDAKESWYECVYSGSGKMPLLCSAIALVGLAVATLAQHVFMMIVISKTTLPISVGWEPDPMPVKNLSWQAGLLFILTWVCFATAEMILLIGLSIESGHLKNWSTPRPSCLVVREGVFTAAGVFSLLTVFLAAGLYVVALRLQQELQDRYTVSQQIL
ncbi:hypothetical protein Droror1_Dr00010936 [Drosera rotundifolia]